MLNFDFLSKRLGQAYQPYFAYIFSRKYCSCYTLLTDKTLLPLLLALLGNICVVIICCPV